MKKKFGKLFNDINASLPYYYDLTHSWINLHKQFKAISCSVKLELLVFFMIFDHGVSKLMFNNI